MIYSIIDIQKFKEYIFISIVKNNFLISSRKYIFTGIEVIFI